MDKFGHYIKVKLFMTNRNITALIFKVIREFQFYEKANFNAKTQNDQIKLNTYVQIK